MMDAPHCPTGSDRACSPHHGACAARLRAGAGQALAEYVLIVALIAVVALVALSFFGSQLSDILSTIAETINS